LSVLVARKKGGSFAPASRSTQRRLGPGPVLEPEQGCARRRAGRPRYRRVFQDRTTGDAFLTRSTGRRWGGHLASTKGRTRGPSGCPGRERQLAQNERTDVGPHPAAGRDPRGCAAGDGVRGADHCRMVQPDVAERIASLIGPARRRSLDLHAVIDRARAVSCRARWPALPSRLAPPLKATRLLRVTGHR
jgi:hypothetical protein